MNKVLKLVSEEELKSEFAQDVRQRYIEQRFLYVVPCGAKKYYQAHDIKPGQEVVENPATEYYYHFLINHITKNEKIAFVSLGCGNSFAEKIALKKLSKEKYNVAYIGVDIAEPMLEMAEKNLEEIDIEKRFIQADILTDHFRDTIRETTSDCSKRIYAFFGGTIGNVNQTDIADTMYNIMLPEDLLWIDVRIRAEKTMESELKFFNRYTEFLTNHQSKFIFNPLNQIGVPIESGSLNLRTENEESVGALMFNFYFRFDTKVVVELNNSTVHFLPNEEVLLHTIRVYHPDTFAKFFNGHELDLVALEVRDGRGQFLFRPKPVLNTGVELSSQESISVS